MFIHGLGEEVQGPLRPGETLNPSTGFFSQVGSFFTQLAPVAKSAIDLQIEKQKIKLAKQAGYTYQPVDQRQVVAPPMSMTLPLVIGGIAIVGLGAFLLLKKK